MYSDILTNYILKITECTNYGNILSVSNAISEKYNNSLSAPNVACGSFAGGIIGCSDMGSRIHISSCFNMAETVEAKYTANDMAKVSGGLRVCSGGIIGFESCSTSSFTRSIIENCYNTSKVYSCGNTPVDKGSYYYNYSYAGGIYAYLNECNVNSCYNIGTVISESNHEAFSGSIGVASSNKLSLSGNYYLSTTGVYDKNSVDTQCTGLSLSEFSSKSSFSSFDFDNIWTMHGDETYIYPELLQCPIKKNKSSKRGQLENIGLSFLSIKPCPNLADYRRGNCAAILFCFCADCGGAGIKAKMKKAKHLLRLWSYWPDSNRRPADYESAALPTEPQ